MHTEIQGDTPPTPSVNPVIADSALPETTQYAEAYKVIRRNGKITRFDASKITVALTKAFLAVEGGHAAASTRIHETVARLTRGVEEALFRRSPDGGVVHIEDIQDQVELELMRSGEHKIARAYVLYREQQAARRAKKHLETPEQDTRPLLHVATAGGVRRPLDIAALKARLDEACTALEDVDARRLLDESLRSLFDGISEKDLGAALVMCARTLIDSDPNYSYVAARLLLDNIRHEAMALLELDVPHSSHADMARYYPQYFSAYIHRAAELELLDRELTLFDLDLLGAALQADRDRQFDYLGLQTLYDRYFIHNSDGVRFELPQAFFMRVAMGLAINEVDREARAIEFYNLLSSFAFMSSTPTLFNAGTRRPQLSSCYLTTVPDKLDGIYSAIRDNALLSKFAGGLGNDWTRVRGLGAHIKGTNGKSQGVVPFLKVASDTAVAVNQCFAGDTLLYTAEGARTIQEVQPGDLVLGQRGEYRTVTKHLTYSQQGDPMVEIDVKHSIRTLKVTDQHPLWAITGIPMEQSRHRSLDWLEKGKVIPRWVDAGKLKRGDYVAQVIPQEIMPVEDFDEDDARLYGILLGDGHCAKNGLEWGVSGNPDKDAHLDFVRNYLEARGIHYWIKNERKHYLQISWSAGCRVARNATTGRLERGSEPGFLFSRDALYNNAGLKRIHPKYVHLPHQQALALIQGLIETDGGISRGKEIYFTNTSHPLVEGLRYQLLRLGVPTAGQYREREQNHQGQRADGTPIRFQGTCKSYDLRIPAVPAIAERVGCRPLGKQNWLVWRNWVFSRVRSIKQIQPETFVHDLKIEGDPSYMTTSVLAHNGGKRKGAVCAYLETWHIDIEEFLELRKNTGDERRRTHDMNSANWVPDLFMERVLEDSDWTLFSPEEVPELHDLTGQAFREKYLEYEAKAARGELAICKSVKAVKLWRKMLGMLFETGHPWMTFKDACNLRYTNQHVGVVHSSNLCTEITLHTNDQEIAVCNLGSVNLAAHVDEDGLDMARLESTISTAMRMLDNVIDYNYYSVPQARNSNLRHRPVGLGIMGFHDALYKQDIPYASEQAVEFADRSMEAVSWFAIKASTDLAEARGCYPTFEGSLWSRGILPIDSLALLEQGRNGNLEVDRSTHLDWDSLRERVVTVGMRNSNTMAIAPTATISNICGVSQSIEPTYQNLYVKSNLSGEFTVINPYLVRDLKAHKLWDEVMVNDLKYYDGCLAPIDRVPAALKQKYATAFEFDSRWLIEAASRRQKWIDQGQSLNLYIAEASGPKLDALYKLAWRRGLKTTYYLRTLGATHVEKTSRRDGGQDIPQDSTPKACSILDPDCEACQ